MLLTFNSLLLSTEKAENQQVCSRLFFFCCCCCLVQSRAPLLPSHCSAAFPPCNSLWKRQPSSPDPSAIGYFPFMLSSSSSRLAWNCFIARPKEFDREWDIETYQLPENCFQDRGIGKGRGKERWAIQSSSTPSRYLWKKSAVPTVQDFNLLKIMPLKDVSSFS